MVYWLYNTYTYFFGVAWYRPELMKDYRLTFKNDNPRVKQFDYGEQMKKACRRGNPEMVRYAGGYASLSTSCAKYVPAFHQYITEYLGNNRAVVRASDGAFVQVTLYYPCGSVYGDMGTGSSVQPY